MSDKFLDKIDTNMLDS